MVFKVLYQTSAETTPKRETTEALYLEAETKEDAIQAVENNTEYNIEFVEPLEGNSLEYEQQSANYKLTTF
ncbi:DNA-directed RNA polymerase subunit epsilon [Pediococcus siamensis]|uniref:DNA-directed RNA polymerase subunit epsilon n=1 Tax=Pediococcus siamensis TaxID=381829 RepID=UPI0039A30008